MADVYERLADFFDRMPASFPRTESGVELKILRHLFSPQEAELVLHMSLINEEARVIAFRARQPLELIESMLDSLAERGLIDASRPAGKPAAYSASQFVIGFYEGQVNKLNRELVELFEEYFPYFARHGSWQKLPQMRVVPVGESIPITTEVMHYERADNIIRGQTDFAVQNCVCRQEREIGGHRCHNDMESCLIIGPTSVNAVASGRARKISKQEALDIIHTAEVQGRVLQPANSQNPIFICTCCSCCCGILRMLKLQDKPAALAANPFVASLNQETCAGCGDCAERCPMDALTLPNGTAEHDSDRCIGCGLCVSTCPTESLQMVRRPAGTYFEIPRNTLDTYLRLGQLRDRLFAAKMAGRMASSAVVSLIAPRKK